MARTTDQESSRVAVLRRSDYKGRAQTYIKHLFLRNYLYRLAFKRLQMQGPPGSRPEIVYVDGFSGPWKSQTSARADTSFSITLSILTDVVEKLETKGQRPTVRAIFVEKDATAFQELRSRVAAYPKIGTRVINGSFEEVIPEVREAVGGTFAFSFVDPTGWTGFALNRLRPLLRLPGEVMVNLMQYSLIRHLDHDPVQSRYEELFGGADWRQDYDANFRAFGERDEAIRYTYLERLRLACDYKYVTSTRIRFPDRQSTFFHLAYGTRHPAGIFVFRETERRCVEEQEEVAYDHVISKASHGGLMGDLLAGIEDPNLGAFRKWRETSIVRAHADFDAWLQHGPAMREDVAAARFMQHPYLERRQVNTWIADAERAGQLGRAEGRDGRVHLTPLARQPPC